MGGKVEEIVQNDSYVSGLQGSMMVVAVTEKEEPGGEPHFWAGGVGRERVSFWT